MRSLTSGIKARPKVKADRDQGTGRPTTRMINNNTSGHRDDSHNAPKDASLGVRLDHVKEHAGETPRTPDIDGVKHQVGDVLGRDDR